MWEQEYKNYGIVNWSKNIVYVHKTPNYRLEINLGSGKVVELATWAGDDVNVIFTEGGKRKVRKYSTPNQFIIIS